MRACKMYPPRACSRERWKHHEVTLILALRRRHDAPARLYDYCTALATRVQSMTIFGHWALSHHHPIQSNVGIISKTCSPMNRPKRIRDGSIIHGHGSRPNAYFQLNWIPRLWSSNYFDWAMVNRGGGGGVHGGMAGSHIRVCLTRDMDAKWMDGWMHGWLTGWSMPNCAKCAVMIELYT